MTEDDAFLEAFEAGRWPLEQWHHRDHIKLAYLYLRRYPFDVAMNRMRDGIRAHNAAHGIPDLPDRGYHETMTQAWMRLVYVTLCEYGLAATADDFFERSPQLHEKKVLRLFYSRDRMMSPGAKVEFVEPDLASLPISGKTSQAGMGGSKWVPGDELGKTLGDHQKTVGRDSVEPTIGQRTCSD